MDKQFLKPELSLYEEEYINYKNVRIYCGTYNVNGRLPDESLSPWLCLNSKDIDIYALGFQELVDLTTTNLLIKNDTNEQLWINSIEEELFNKKNFKSKTTYKLLTKNRMFGLFLLVYINEKLFENKAVTEILKSQVATGIMDMVGNKGSLGISFKLFESRICFVCSHFAADTDKLEKRNSDFRSALLKLNFESEINNNNLTLRIDDHDAIFWFGDLNYRLDKLTLTRTLKLIASQDYEELLKYDQMSQEKKLLKIFENYNEGAINFRPTYKYITKSDLYEKQSLVTNLDQEDNFGRVKLPSWTDRILWKSPKCKLVQYSCINTITISDHKPVYALFDLEVKEKDNKKYMKLCEKLLKDADKRLNELMPHIELEKNEFNFGDCYYYDAKRLEMIVRNIGKSRSNVDIIFHENNPTGSNILNQWVTFMPQHKERFEPASEYKVELTTCFNPKMLPKLIKQRKLEDFLIVRCLNGNDSFATVICSYKPTIIGMSLKSLSTLSDSFETCDFKELENLEQKIREYELEFDKEFTDNLKTASSIHQLDKLDRLGINTESSIIDSKIEIFNLTFSMVTEMIQKDELFNKDLSSEYKFLLEYLIKRCESDQNLSDSETTITIEEQKNAALISLSKKNFTDFESYKFDLELLAELLYDLLYALPNSLIPRRYIDYCCFLSSNQTNFEDMKLFQIMPKSHLDLFKLLVKFLRVYLKSLCVNESNYSNMIAEAIFQIDKTDNLKTCLNENSFNFLKLFIQNENFF